MVVLSLKLQAVPTTFSAVGEGDWSELWGWGWMSLKKVYGTWVWSSRFNYSKQANRQDKVGVTLEQESESPWGFRSKLKPWQWDCERPEKQNAKELLNSTWCNTLVKERFELLISNTFYKLHIVLMCYCE